MSHSVILNPVSDGQWYALTPVPASPATHYDKVITSGDGKYCYWSESYEGNDLYYVDAPPSGTVEKVIVYAAMGVAATLLQRQLYVVTYNIGYGSGWTIVGAGTTSYEWALNPHTGEAWTREELLAANTFQAGVGIKTTGVPSGAWCDKLWVEVVMSAATYPSDELTRVTGIRHIYRPGIFRMLLSLGDVSNTIEVAEHKVRKELEIPEQQTPEAKPTPPEEPKCVEGSTKGKGFNKYTCMGGRWWNTPEAEEPWPTSARVTAPEPTKPPTPSYWGGGFEEYMERKKEPVEPSGLPEIRPTSFFETLIGRARFTIEKFWEGLTGG